MANEKHSSTLAVWQITDLGGFHILTGLVMNDSRFKDGTFVHTSKLVRVDFEKCEAETLNTIYKLV